MKYYSELLTLFLVSSSAFSFSIYPSYAMEDPKKNNAKQTSRAPRTTPKPVTPLPIPQSFYDAAEFEGIPITPSHILNRRFLLGSFLGNHAEEERKELTRKGVENFSNNELNDARVSFERSALYGDPVAMGQLGKLFENDQTNPQKFSQALQWYILAFQIKWMETGEHYPFAINSLKNLSTEEAKTFIKTVPEFYPLKGNNERSFEKLYQAYNNKCYEPYLTEEERRVKEAAFKPGEITWRFDEGLIGQVFLEKIRKKKAAQLYWKYQCSGAFYNIGLMLSQEQLLAEDFQEIGIPNICKTKEPLTNFAWAARFYAEAGIPESLVNLGNMLSNGDLTVSELQKSGALHFLKIKNETRLTNYQLAAWLYKKSEHRPVFVNLAYMLKHQQITLKDLEEMEVIKLLNIKDKQNFNANTIEGYLNIYSKTPEGLYNLGKMLLQKQITPGELQEMGASELLGIENITSLSPHKLQAFFCIKSGIPHALELLGNMLTKKQTSPQELQNLGANKLLEIQDVSSFTHYELAAIFFTKAGTPIASHNLGIMLRDKKITPHYLQGIGAIKLLGIHDMSSFTDYELVALFLSKIEKAKAFYNLGVMLQEGLITPQQLQKIGLAQRFKIPEEALHTNIEWAAFFFEKAKTPKAFYNLGIHYFNSNLGLQLPEEERLKKAEDYFNISRDNRAKYCLAYMYIMNQTGTAFDPVTRYQKALDLLEFVRLRGIEDQGFLDHTKKLLKFQQNLQNLQKASVAIQQEKTPVSPCVSVQEEKTQLSPSSEFSSVYEGSSEVLTQETLTDQSQQGPSTPPLQTLDTSSKKQVKRKEKKPKIIKKKIEVLKEEIKKNAKPPQASGFMISEKTNLKDFDVEFLSKKAERNFNALLGDEKSPSPHTIKKLIHNIFNQPIGSKGMGRPKALKGNMKGWWERRINGKDRLIYKIESGKIIIYSCEGHL